MVILACSENYEVKRLISALNPLNWRAPSTAEHLAALGMKYFRCTLRKFAFNSANWPRAKQAFFTRDN
jgi:hypothetical protein